MAKEGCCANERLRGQRMEYTIEASIATAQYQEISFNIAVSERRNNSRYSGIKCKPIKTYLVNMTKMMRRKAHQLFDKLSAYKEHEGTHTGKKLYRCKHCKKTFSRPSLCKQHERTHTGEKPYTCKHCKKCFSNLGNCKKHERTHTGEKPYTCKHCKKTFSQSSSCKRHERTHTGEKPYTCRHCKKGFGSLGDCKRHERAHTGEKPFSCKHCKKTFSQSSSCKRHERTHTGEKLYTCKDCKKGFSLSSACKQHERKHAIDSSLKRKQPGQYLELRTHLSEPTATHVSKDSGLLSSVIEENSSGQVESLSCWICQEEFCSKTGLIRHYDDHMMR